ncbi:rhomboid family intramembrane serine protease [Actinomyces sp. 2119]|nr:rhomboid family intramembrane serine protease [Actinomyces sp. 2119]
MSQQPVSTPPVCPRHPQTAAYVRCQRCGRPVCPECQVPSAVGVHCVDCVRTSQAGRRRVRTVLGGRPTSGTAVTNMLILACVVVYIAQFLLQTASIPLDRLLGFVPAAALEEPWRFLSTAFLHGPPLHLAFNMWALWVLGSVLEPLLGRWRFLAVYLLSALGGSVMIYLLASPASQDWVTLTVGASGAVFGLFATTFVVQRRLGRDTSQIVGLLVLNAVISLLGANISWQGHLGGLLTGGLLAAVFAWAPRDRRSLYGVVATVGAAVVLVALVLVRSLLVQGPG